MEQVHLVVPLETFLYDTALSPNTEYRCHACAHNIKLMAKWVHSAHPQCCKHSSNSYIYVSSAESLMGMYVCIYSTSVCACAPSPNIPHSAVQISLCLNPSPVYNQLKTSTTLPEHVLFGFFLHFSPGGSSGTSQNVVTICEN